MRVLVLWADEYSTNLGVRVLAVGTEALVRRVWPDADVEHVNFGSRNPHLPIGSLRSLAKERVLGRRGMQEWLSGFDLVIDTRSGDSFADIYGLKRLKIMSAVAEFATEAGTPVILGPQTIGPFDSLQGRTLGRFSLRRSALTMARDSASAAYAASLGRPVDVLTTDVVFALPAPKVEKTRDVVLNISGLLWQPSPHVDSAAYRRIVTELFAALTDAGRTVTLLAHVIESDNPDNDAPAIRAFAAECAPTAEIVVPKDLDDVRSAAASARVVVGSRMHACLNALSVGTPAVPLAYSRKFEPLMHDLGWNHLVDLRSDGDPVGNARALILDADLEADMQALTARADALLGPAVSALRAFAS